MCKAYYLTLSSENRPRIVAAVASCLLQAGGNVLEAQLFDDFISSRFFSACHSHRVLLNGSKTVVFGK